MRSFNLLILCFDNFSAFGAPTQMDCIADQLCYTASLGDRPLKNCTSGPGNSLRTRSDAAMESVAIVEDGSIDALHFDGYGDKEALEDKYVLTLPCQYRPSNCD
ncbi:hypothetical protein DSO57_1036287 [Entomophthora muscae]|uniref:Uncharacterized protein n=1 Tax=Entomophthora muscae TaxID=34485 RepID=A0ACC2TA39_9FUNG|nr:hypothetical protein DSO57_1036287 [Entomophthora muscae]